MSTKKRKRSSSTRVSKSARGTAAKASLALKIARSLQKQVEKKVFSFDITANPMASTPGAMLFLLGIAEGISEDDRIGNKIRTKTFELRYRVDWDPLDIISQTAFGRLTVFRDKQQVADTNPSVSNLFGTGVVNIQELFNHNKVPSRFEILVDRVIPLAAPGNNLSPEFGGGGHSRIFGSLKIKYDHDILYNGPTLNDIEKNGLYMCLTGSQAANAPTFTAQGRIMYTG